MLSVSLKWKLYLPFLATTLFRPEFLHRPDLLCLYKCERTSFLHWLSVTHCKSCAFFELDPHGEVPWRKKTFTLLNRLAFCLRIVLKYRIKASKALDLFTFHFSYFRLYFEENKGCCCCCWWESGTIPGGGGIHDFRFNPAIKYTLQTLTCLNFFL